MGQSGVFGHYYHSGIFHHAEGHGHEGSFQLRRGIRDGVCDQVLSITCFPLLFYFLPSYRQSQFRLPFFYYVLRLHRATGLGPLADEQAETAAIEGDKGRETRDANTKYIVPANSILFLLLRFIKINDT